MLVIKGSIPSKICYHFADPKEMFIGNSWEIDHLNPTSNKYQIVLQACVADAENSSTMRTSAQHALYTAANYNKYTVDTINKDIQDNNSIKDIKLISKTYDAYKVIAGKYCVDLQHDVLMDVILNCGVSKGGILKGEFIWAIQDGKPKLIRKNSQLHKLLQEYSKRKETKNVKKKELEVGGIYQSLKKDIGVFIGYVDTVYYELSDEDWKKRYARSWGTAASIEDVDFTYKTVSNASKLMLFYEIGHYKRESIEKIKQLIQNKEEIHNCVVLKKRHNFIEKVDTISLPENYIESIRQNFIIKAKDAILEYSGHKEKTGYYKINAHDLKYRISSYSGFLNMKPYKSAPTSLFDLQKYLTFS